MTLREAAGLLGYKWQELDSLCNSGGSAGDQQDEGPSTQVVAGCLARVGREMEILGWLEKLLPLTSWGRGEGGPSVCLNNPPSLGVPVSACLGAFIFVLDSCPVAHLETHPVRVSGAHLLYFGKCFE